MTLVFVFDGPQRPPVKRGRTVVTRPLWYINHVKNLVEAFGFYSRDVRAYIIVAPLNLY